MFARNCPTCEKADNNSYSQTQPDQAKMSRHGLSNFLAQAVSLYSDSEMHSKLY